MKTKSTSVTLRKRLRIDTAEAHERIDKLASQLDLSNEEDLISFLSAQLESHQRLLECLSQKAEWLKRRIILIKSDLSELGEKVRPVSAAPVVGHINPLAIAYVICGSYLGSKVLRKTLMLSTSERVHNASSFLKDDVPAEQWSMLIKTLENLPADGLEAEDIIDSANRCFSVFELAFDRVISRESKAYA
ncbi:biliverdin-producing heme oxygenase [uncultured Nisaea sp.]|uniref:biliverdin-producing heme oxygenase n=1 Tax=uncultured Nisaea sp. TaxID=538215 RepID=UPI0030EF3B12|tara:strand:- start:8340 stop:8909 length:570 start_codon:yes stop_codon:yes gene_type:complete